MRRTRHVVLPVRSWQYVGLMVVSLACLTLGLVSRDREGKSGSLTGPELKHTAPHEVDACPNDYPFILQSRITERRILERRTRDSQTVRAALENERLNRMHISRSTTKRDVRTRTNERRSVSLDRRQPDISRLRDVRSARITQFSRSLDRRTRESDRVSSRMSVRRVELQKHMSINERRGSITREDSLRSREGRSLSERRDRSTMERQNRSRTGVRRENIRVEERRLLDRQIERRERVRNIKKENRHRLIDPIRERTLSERREVRATETFNTRSGNSKINSADSIRRNVRVSRVSNLNNRQESRYQRNSGVDERLSRSRERVDIQRFNVGRTNNYPVAETEFLSVKSMYIDGNYELIRQTFVAVLCTIYTASLFKRKSGFIGNILPEMNQLRVW